MNNWKIFSLTTCAVSAFAAGAWADELDERVKKIVFFTPGSSVIAVMQRQPDAEEVASVAGILKTRWRWSASNGRTVVVTLIEGRVVVTKTCTAVPDC